jgi:endonuclease-3
MLGGWSAERISPFKILIGTILSARSRDEMTEVIARQIFRRYPTPRALAKAKRRDVEKILKPIGFYRAKANYIIETAQMVTKIGVPETIEGLMAFPGVGRKVANCVLVYAFGQEAIPVDIHVHRISNRLGWVKTKQPEETEKELVKIVPRKWWPVLNEVLVAHGKEICRPIGPKCDLCPVNRWCAKRVVSSPTGRNPRLARNQ